MVNQKKKKKSLWGEKVTIFGIGKFSHYWFVFLKSTCTYITSRRREVDATGVEPVVRVLNQLRVAEFVEDAAQRAPVPVVGHAAAVIALAGHVAQRVVGQFLQKSASRSARQDPAAPWHSELCLPFAHVVYKTFASPLFPFICSLTS